MAFITDLSNILFNIDFPRPEKIIEIYNKIEQSPITTPPPPLQIIENLVKKIYNLYMKNKLNKNEFSNKELKLLPYTIYFKKEDFILIKESTIIIKLLDILKEAKPFIIARLIKEYLMNFQYSEGAQLIRDFIFSYLSNYKGSKRFILNWKENQQFFFTDNCFFNTINLIKKETDNLEIILSKINIDRTLRKSNFIKFLSLKFSEIFKDSFDKVLYDKFYQLIHEREELIFSDLNFMTQIATNIIPYVSENYKDEIYPFFLKHLKHPLVPEGRVKWQYVSENAKAIFNNWLNKQNLELFFEIISNSPGSDPKWKYRRKFWEAYIAYIEESWVIFGKRIISDFDNILKKKKLPYGKLMGASSNQCVFLIKIKDYIFVEWNQSGALRIYSKSNFPLKLGDSEYWANDLRHENFIERILHQNSEGYSWQRKLSNWLYKILNIYTEDYRL